MKDEVKERIDKYLSRCGEDGDEFIARVFIKDRLAKCGYCKAILTDFKHNYKPNFCPECGVLLDWTKED